MPKSLWCTTGNSLLISLKLPAVRVPFWQIATRQQVLFGAGAEGYQLSCCAICMRNSQIVQRLLYFVILLGELTVQ
jgi:hypothetical protein